MYPLEFLFFKHLHLTSAAQKIEFLSEQKHYRLCTHYQFSFHQICQLCVTFALFGNNISKSVFRPPPDFTNFSILCLQGNPEKAHIKVKETCLEVFCKGSKVSGDEADLHCLKITTKSLVLVKIQIRHF